MSRDGLLPFALLLLLLPAVLSQGEEQGVDGKGMDEQRSAGSYGAPSPVYYPPPPTGYYAAPYQAPVPPPTAAYYKPVASHSSPYEGKSHHGGYGKGYGGYEGGYGKGYGGYEGGYGKGYGGGYEGGYGKGNGGGYEGGYGGGYGGGHGGGYGGGHGYGFYYHKCFIPPPSYHKSYGHSGYGY